MARMKYHGEVPVLFNDLARPPVTQGEVFDVPDSERERYSRRPDIEDLDAPPPPVEEPGAEAASETEVATVTEATEATPPVATPDTTPAPAAEAAPPTE